MRPFGHFVIIHTRNVEKHNLAIIKAQPANIEMIKGHATIIIPKPIGPNKCELNREKSK